MAEVGKVRKGRMRSLRSKMLLYFLVTLVVIFAAMCLVVTLKVKGVVTNLTEGLTQQVVVARAAEIGKYIQGLENDVKTWAENSIIRTGDIAAIQKYLKSRQSSLRSDFEMMLFADLQGNYYASLGNNGTIADREYFKKIVSEGAESAISNPVQSRATGRMIFVVAHEVKNEAGERIGVVAATILLDTFNDIINDIHISDKGRAWVVDSTGLIIAHPSDDVRMQLNLFNSDESGYLGLDDIAREMVGKDNASGQGEYMDTKGQRCKVIYTSIPGSSGWSMAYSLSVDEMMETVNSTTLVIIVVVVAAMIIIAVIVTLVSASLLKPIKASTALARALAEGNLDYPSNVKSNDEVGQLASILDNEVRGAFKAIERAQVVSEKKAQYQAAEVDKLLAALRRLSRGELKFDLTVAPGDADTEELHALFAEIAENLGGALREIRGYIGEISYVLGEMAQGNMNVSIQSEYMGEFVALKDSINTIADSLNEVISGIGTAANQVAAGTRQVSDGSQEISQGATEQASAIEELTATVTQIAAQTRQNAISAGEANELTLQAKDEAARGNESMKTMQRAMDEISEASRNISKIIKAIDDIAFQTNILALNAAVEAARAGVHGKGFAVVAEEVRNLAARSASAAKETTELIEGTISKTEAGARIVSDMAAALDSIVASVEKSAQLVSEIAAASNEQATAIAQVNRGIEQLSAVVQTNSATSEEAAAAAEELSSQAEILKSMVEQFRLRESVTKPARPAVLKEAEQEALPAETRIHLSDNDFGKY